jgi:glucose-6-phosphate 1-dehydrogenase
MAKPHSDALVIFGVTGDLAHKMIFPALYAMVKKGALKVPVLGVTFPKVEYGAFAQARDGQYRAVGRNR